MLRALKGLVLLVSVGCCCLPDPLDVPDAVGRMGCQPMKTWGSAVVKSVMTGP